MRIADCTPVAVHAPSGASSRTKHPKSPSHGSQIGHPRGLISHTHISVSSTTT